MPQFDPHGLWSFQAVWFSRWGSLVTTLEALVVGAPQGYFASELQQLLHVEVQDALLQLVEQRRIARQQVTGLFLYSSWIRARWHADASSYWRRKCHGSGFANLARAASQWGKNAPGNLSNREVVGTPHGRRSDEQPEVDAQNHGQDRCAITSAGHPGWRTHGRPIARQAAFPAPRKPQKDRRREPLVTRPTVPPHYPAAPPLLPSRQSHHQRRCQEARTGGQLQESRQEMGARPHPGQRPRLSLARHGHRPPIRHL